MEWYQILVTGFFCFPIAFTVIVEGPKSAVHPEGTNVTLQCITSDVRNSIVWEDITENTVIFIDKTKNTQRAKFDNFFISDAEENFSLTIVNAQLSDEGFYSCVEGDESRTANVTIEAWPKLSVFVNNTLLVPENGITLTEDDQVIVLCIAEGAKPAVYLTLKFGQNEWIEADNIATSKDGLRFITEASVTHSVSRDDTTFTCKATGQISIPPSSAKISIDVLHKPVCHVELRRNTAECQCVSNPQVSGYRWYVNGTSKGTELLLPINDHMPANLTCLATNAVGTGASAPRYVSPANVDPGAISASYVIIVVAAVIAFACCIIACCVIFYCLYRRCKEEQTFYDARDDNWEPEERDLEDDQQFVGPSSGNIEDETKKSSLVHQSEKVDDDNNGNSADKNGEKDLLLSQNKEYNNDVEGDNLEPEEKGSSEDSEDDQIFVDASSDNVEHERVSQHNKTSFDHWGIKQNEKERNLLVIESENNKKEDNASPDSNVPGNDIKHSESASTSQDKLTRDDYEDTAL